MDTPHALAISTIVTFPTYLTSLSYVVIITSADFSCKIILHFQNFIQFSALIFVYYPQNIWIPIRSEIHANVKHTLSAACTDGEVRLDFSRTLFLRQERRPDRAGRMI